MTSPRAVRILIVDDSAVMRSLLRSVVGSDERLEVAGTASNGAAALSAVDAMRADLVLLDVEMPVMDGLSTLKQMRARCQLVPVIMCSALTQRGAKVTIEALASGAADYVTKPSGHVSREASWNALAQDLIPKILAHTAWKHSFPPSSSSFYVAAHIAPESEVVTAGPLLSSVRPSVLNGALGDGFQIPTSVPSVVLIGVSTGGPAALEQLLPALPATFPLPVLIVQHMPELFTKSLAERLDARCLLGVAEAKEGERIRPGKVYIAKGGWHMEVAVAAGNPERRAVSSSLPVSPVLHLTQNAPVHHCRPAVDVLFRSAVAVYGPGALGVVLTGMGSDGLAGSRLIRENYGTVLAQDQSTSAVWGMPGSVSQAGLAHRILPLSAIAPEIIRLATPGQCEAQVLRESAV
jgi:two-component system chemotaxis response regulator CheB